MIYPQRAHIIVSQCIYQFKTRRTLSHKDILKDIRDQDNMIESKKYLEEEVYPGGDAYSDQVLSELTFEDVQLLIICIQ